MLLLLFSRVYTFHCEISHCKRFAAVQLLSHSIVSNSLQPQGLQHTRLPCLSLCLRVWANSCPLSRWCHPTISPHSPPNCLIFSWTSLYYNINAFSGYGSFTHTSPDTTQIQGLLIKFTVNFTHRAEGLSGLLSYIPSSLASARDFKLWLPISLTPKDQYLGSTSYGAFSLGFTLASVLSMHL